MPGGLVWRPAPPAGPGPDTAAAAGPGSPGAPPAAPGPGPGPPAAPTAPAAGGGWPPVLVAEDLLVRGGVAAFSCRAGGSSAPPFDGCNLGLRVGDDLRAVLRNRRRVATVLGVAGLPWATLRQVHSARVLRADHARLGQGPPEALPPLGEGDALVTAEPGILLAVLVADCAPVLLADPAAGAVAAVHAGWRGLAAGVVEAAVEALAALGADPAATVGLVGPAVGGCCYEVGEDVRATVGARCPAALATTRAGRPALDPALGAAEALARAGVGEVRVAGECTFDHPGRHFSHRRDHGRTGRQAGLIALVPPAAGVEAP